MIENEGYLLVLNDRVLTNDVMLRSEQERTELGWGRVLTKLSREGTRFAGKGCWSNLECPSESSKIEMRD